MLVPPRLANREYEARPFERRHIGGLVARVADGQVDIDDRLGRQAGDARRSDVLQCDHAIAEREPDAVSQLIERGRPGRIGIDDVDGSRSGCLADPDVLLRIEVIVARDLIVRGHRRRA